MRYWALKYTSLFIKGLAFVTGFLSVIAYFLALFGGAAFFDSLSLAGFGMRTGINNIGFMATFLVSTCGLMLLLSSSIFTYAAGQYLDLLISIEENVIGLRYDVRSRRSQAVPKSPYEGWEQLPPEPPVVRIRDQRRPMPFKDEQSRWYRPTPPSVERQSTFDESKAEYRPDPPYVEHPTTFKDERSARIRSKWDVGH